MSFRVEHSFNIPPLNVEAACGSSSSAQQKPAAASGSAAAVPGRAAWDRLYDYLIAEGWLSPQGEWLRGELLPPLELCDAQKARLAQIFDTTYCVKVARKKGSSVEVAMRLSEFIQNFGHQEIEIVGGGVDWILGREFYEPFLRKIGAPEELLCDELFAEMSRLPQDIDIRFAVPYIDSARLGDAPLPLFERLSALAGIPLRECIDEHRQKWAAKPEDANKYAIVTLKLYDAADTCKSVVDIDFLFEKELQRKFLNKRDAHGLQVKVPLDGTAKIVSDLPCTEEAFVHYITRRLDTGVDKAIDLTGIAMSLVSTTKGRFPCEPTYFSVPCKTFGTIRPEALFEKITAAVGKHAKGRQQALMATLFNAFYFLGEKQAKALLQQLDRGYYCGVTLVEQLLRNADVVKKQRTLVQSLAAAHAIVGWGARGVAHQKDKQTIEIECRDEGISYSLFIRQDIQRALDVLGRRESWNSLAALSVDWSTTATLEGLPLEAAHRDAIDRIDSVDEPAAKHLAFLLLLKYHSLFPSRTSIDLLLERYQKICGQLTDAQRQNSASLLGNTLVANPTTYAIETMLLLQGKLNNAPDNPLDALLATGEPDLIRLADQRKTGKKRKGGDHPGVTGKRKPASMGVPQKNILSEGTSASVEPIAGNPVIPSEQGGITLWRQMLAQSEDLEMQKKGLTEWARDKTASRNRDLLLSAFNSLMDSPLSDLSKLSMLLNKDIQKLLSDNPDCYTAAATKLTEAIDQAPIGTKAQMATALCRVLATKASSSIPKKGAPPFALADDTAKLLGSLLAALSAHPAFYTRELRQNLSTSMQAILSKVEAARPPPISLLNGCYLCKLPISLPPGKGRALSPRAEECSDIHSLQVAENAYHFARSCESGELRAPQPPEAIAFAEAWLRHQCPVKAYPWVMQLNTPHVCVSELADALLAGAHFDSLKGLLSHAPDKLFAAGELAKRWTDYAAVAGSADALAIFRSKRELLAAHHDKALLDECLLALAERCYAEHAHEKDALDLLLKYGCDSGSVTLRLAQRCRKTITAPLLCQAMQQVAAAKDVSIATFNGLMEASTRLNTVHPEVLFLIAEEAFEATFAGKGTTEELKTARRHTFANALRCLLNGLYPDAEFVQLNEMRRACCPKTKENELIAALLAHPEMPAAGSVLAYLWKQKKCEELAAASYAGNLIRALLVHRPSFDDRNWTDLGAGLLMQDAAVLGLTSQELGDAIVQYISSALDEADRHDCRLRRMKALECAIVHMKTIMKKPEWAYPLGEKIFGAVPHLFDDADAEGSLRTFMNTYTKLTNIHEFPVPSTVSKRGRERYIHEQQEKRVVAAVDACLKLKRTHPAIVNHIMSFSYTLISNLLLSDTKDRKTCIDLIETYIYSSLFWANPSDQDATRALLHQKFCSDLLKIALKNRVFDGQEYRLAGNTALIDGELTIYFNKFTVECHLSSVIAALTHLLKDPLPTKVEKAFTVFTKLQKQFILVPADAAPLIELLISRAITDNTPELTTMTRLAEIAKFLAHTHLTDEYPNPKDGKNLILLQSWQMMAPSPLTVFFHNADTYYHQLKERNSPNINYLFNLIKLVYVAVERNNVINADIDLHDALTRIMLAIGLHCHNPLKEPSYYHEENLIDLIEKSNSLLAHRMINNWIEVIDGTRGNADYFLFGRLLVALYNSKAKDSYPILVGLCFIHMRYILQNDVAEEYPEPSLENIKTAFKQEPLDREAAIAAISTWVNLINDQQLRTYTLAQSIEDCAQDLEYWFASEVLADEQQEQL